MIMMESPLNCVSVLRIFRRSSAPLANSSSSLHLQLQQQQNNFQIFQKISSKIIGKKRRLKKEKSQDSSISGGFGQQLKQFEEEDENDLSLSSASDQEDIFDEKLTDSCDKVTNKKGKFDRNEDSEEQQFESLGAERKFSPFSI